MGLSRSLYIHWFIILWYLAVQHNLCEQYHLSVRTITYWITFIVLVKKPTMSVATNSSWPLAGNGYNYRFKFGSVPLCAHAPKLLAVVNSSLDMRSEKKLS